MKCAFFVAIWEDMPIMIWGRGVGHASATFEFSPNFSQVYMEFCKSLFSRSERLTYYVLKLYIRRGSQLNPTQYTDMFAFKLRPTFNTLLEKRCVMNGCGEKPREM